MLQSTSEENSSMLWVRKLCSCNGHLAHEQDRLQNTHPSSATKDAGWFNVQSTMKLQTFKIVEVWSSMRGPGVVCSQTCLTAPWNASWSQLHFITALCDLPNLYLTSMILAVRFWTDILIVKIDLSGTLLVSKFFPFYSSSAVNLTWHTTKACLWLPWSRYQKILCAPVSTSLCYSSH